jgi:pSer/pThr/pTyr-binding forkhead associated (FHA) protein
MDDRPKAKTLHELLLELKAGYHLHKPILIEIEPGTRNSPEVTIDRTMTLKQPLDWVEEYGKELASNTFILLGPNTLAAGLDAPVTIGRSRRCDVRVENDSVSKVHGSVVFDAQGGEYFLIDENSRNGTRINGEPLTPGVPTAVWSGAHVSFGDAVFVFLDPPTLRKLAKLAV